MVTYFLTKHDVKSIFTIVFGVKVLAINSYILPRKLKKLGKFRGSKNIYKRVILTLL